MTVCAKALSSSSEECWFVEPVTISQPAANPASYFFGLVEGKKKHLSFKICCISFLKKDYKVIQRDGKFFLNYTAQNTGEAGEGPADVEPLRDAKSSPAEGQIVVSLPTWEYLDRRAASMRRRPLFRFVLVSLWSLRPCLAEWTCRQKRFNTHQPNIPQLLHTAHKSSR